jgi:hypothetical protein
MVCKPIILFLLFDTSFPPKKKQMASSPNGRSPLETAFPLQGCGISTCSAMASREMWKSRSGEQLLAWLFRLQHHTYPFILGKRLLDLLH